MITEINNLKSQIEPNTFINLALNDLTTNVTNTLKITATISGMYQVSERYETNILTEIANYREKVTPKEAGPTDKEIMPSEVFNLGIIGDENSLLLKIMTLLLKYIKHIDAAILNYDDEIYRENEIALFTRLFYELDYFKHDNPNFIDIVNAMRIGLLYKKDTFQLKEIMALKETLKELIDNINVTDEKYFKILDKLEEYFNIAGPLSEATFKYNSDYEI